MNQPSSPSADNPASPQVSIKTDPLFNIRVSARVYELLSGREAFIDEKLGQAFDKETYFTQSQANPIDAFSVHLAPAWGVVETMIEKGYCMKMIKEGPVNGVLFIHADWPKDGPERSWCFSRSVAEAIAFAVLTAFGDHSLFQPDVDPEEPSQEV